MEYVFGTTKIDGAECECLKTIGDAHSDFTGLTTTKREYTDSVITDTFNAVNKYHSDEVDGKCYDWYQINNHSRSFDKYTPDKDGIENKFADNDDAIIEIANMISDTNDALTELAGLVIEG